MVVVGVGRADKFGRIVGKRAGRVAKVEDRPDKVGSVVGDIIGR